MTTVTTRSEATRSEVEQNRRVLHDAGVVAVSLVGGPGCGKSMLIQRVMERMAPEIRLAVIAAGSEDQGATPHYGGQPNRHVTYINGNSPPCLDASLVGTALDKLDLATLDLLIIENVGTLTVPAEYQDVGQDQTVTVLSVAAGDDKARKHPDLVKSADAIVLNKIDLSLAVPFDLASFRADVRRINPLAELFEISALDGRGVDRWIEWLTRRVSTPCTSGEPSHWFG